MIEFDTESEFDAHLFRGPKSVARSLGWLTYHTLKSKGSQRGFPDRFCTRDRNFLVETKGRKTPIQPEQIEWLTRIAKAGGEVYLWRPSDLPDADRVLGRRMTFVPATTMPFAYLLTDEGPWTPGSLWLPEGCRYDELAHAA